MDRFLEMRVFAAVVDAGSFVKAADALDMSKAAVSRIVADLEARLSVRLLHRTTRRQSLTAEGEVFHVRSKEVLAAVEEAESEVTERSGRAVGILKVSAPVTFGVMHLAPLWAGFMEQNPDVELEVNLSDRMVDVVEEAIDLAVRIARLHNSTLVSRQLSTTRLVLCASKHYLRKHGTPRTVEDLGRHDVLAYNLLAMGDTWEFTGPEGVVSVRVKPRLRSNSGDTCRAIALGHQGIILQPTFMVHLDLQSGDLVEVMPQYQSVDLGIYAVYPTRKHLSPKVRALIDYLSLSLAKQAWVS